MKGVMPATGGQFADSLCVYVGYCLAVWWTCTDVSSQTAAAGSSETSVSASHPEHRNLTSHTCEDNAKTSHLPH